MKVGFSPARSYAFRVESGVSGAEDDVRINQALCIDGGYYGRLATLFRDRKLILCADQLQSASETVLR